MLTQAQLQALLDFNQDTGVFTWIHRPCGPSQWNTRYAGKQAGSFDKDGYIQISVLSKRVKAHRLAWLWVTGDSPSCEIDHINCIKHDNRIANLRDVSRSANAHNMKSAKRNSQSGLLGVTASLDKWRATIVLDKKHIYLGTFATKESASEAYLSAKQKYHGEVQATRRGSMGAGEDQGGP